MTRPVAVLAALLALVLPAYPLGAGAATDLPSCTGEAAVTVLVDPHGGEPGLRSFCDPDGGGTVAAELFERHGFPLTYVAGQPGFVCRVAGRPEDEPCVNGLDPGAYWSLWWSDGEGDWVYSSLSVDALEVPGGGAVAFSWDEVPGARPPSVEVGEAVPDTGGHGDREPQAVADPAEADGLPGWVAPGVLGVLLVAVAGVSAMRRRSSRREGS